MSAEVVENALSGVGTDTSHPLEDVNTALPEAGAEEPEGEEEKPGRTYTQKELDAKLAKSHDRRERKYNRQLAELNGKLELLTAQQSKPAQKADEAGTKLEAPKRADFESYEDYLEARTDFRTDQALQKQKDSLKQEQEEAGKTQKQAATKAEFDKMANKRVDAGRKEYADFDSVINDAFEDGVIEPNSELFFGLVESDIGHKLAYYLANPANHAEAERIKALSPRGIHRELGKLELKLASKEKAAPETMEPIGGGRPIKSADPMDDNISMDEFVRRRNAAEQRKRKG